jgi:hypothetical protein
MHKRPTRRATPWKVIAEQRSMHVGMCRTPTLVYLPSRLARRIAALISDSPSNRAGWYDGKIIGATPTVRERRRQGHPRLSSAGPACLPSIPAARHTTTTFGREVRNLTVLKAPRAYLPGRSFLESRRTRAEPHFDQLIKILMGLRVDRGLQWTTIGMHGVGQLLQPDPPSPAPA